MTDLQPRRRRTPETARAEALEAARRLLLTDGPEAVTLKSVAGEIGMSHANLLHHFGSAEGLQTALMADMVRDLNASLQDTVRRVRAGEAPPRLLVETVFDVFDAGGAGKLAAWLALLGDLDRLAPVRAAFDELIAALARDFPGDEALMRRTRQAVLFVTLNAFGDAVIGKAMRDMLGMDDRAARDVATRLLPELVRPAEVTKAEKP